MIDQNLNTHGAEAAIIAAVMRSPAAADEVLWLQPDDFGHPLMSEVWRAAKILRAEGRTCDSMALHSEVQRAGKGGLFGADPAARWAEILKWGKMAEADGTLSERAREVREAAARRDLLARAERLAAEARNLSTPLNTLQEDARLLGTAAGDRLAINRSVTGAQAIAAAWAEIEAIQKGERPAGLSTGFPRLDGALGGGLRPGDLMAAGAIPGGGKSAFALQLAIRHCWNGRHVHLASAEMPTEAVATRALSAMTRIDTRPMRRCRGLTVQQRSTLAQRETELEKRIGTTLTIDDASRTMSDICAEARRQHAEHPLSLLIVDHLHALQVPPKAESTEKGIRQMVEELRNLALALRIPVVMLAQFNRGVHMKTRPTMADWKESSSIEQWATIGLLFHEPDPSSRDNGVRNIEIIVGKCREGLQGLAIPYHYHAAVHRFEEMQEQPPATATTAPKADAEGPDY